MKIAIIGVGAIGGFVGARLAHAGEDVTFIARGANLEALKTRGIRLVMGDGSEQAVPRVNATADYAAAGPQDMVILALKAHQVEAVAPRGAEAVRPRYGGGADAERHTLLVLPPARRRAGGHADPQRRSARGSIGANIPCERVIGCVVYPATELLAPGVIKHVEGNRFPVGEPDGTISERVTRVSECFIRGGLQAPVLSDIRAEIWLKLWGNLTFNPISALSRATLAGICQYPLSRALAHTMMSEAQSIADKLGITFRVPIEKRIAGAERVGHHKTSMLQDVEARRTLEIDALLGSVVELARLTDTPTPHLDTVYALTKLLAKSLEEDRPLLGGARAASACPLALRAGARWRRLGSRASIQSTGWPGRIGRRKRNADMNVHEYQGKEILRRYGVATPRGMPCFSVAEADAAARAAGRQGVGGQGADPRRRPRQGRRRQGGEIAATKSTSIAAKILGMTLVTHQTGPARPAGAGACWWRRAPTSARNCTSAWWSTALRSASP